MVGQEGVVKLEEFNISKAVTDKVANALSRREVGQWGQLPI